MYLGTERGVKELKVKFFLVEANTSNIVFLGRSRLNAFGTIVLTPHLSMKYPLDDDTICTVRADQKIAEECYAASLKVEPWVPRSKMRCLEVAMIDLDLN